MSGMNMIGICNISAVVHGYHNCKWKETYKKLKALEL